MREEDTILLLEKILLSFLNNVCEVLLPCLEINLSLPKQFVKDFYKEEDRFKYNIDRKVSSKNERI